MTVPEWFCSVVCAGLNIDDVADGAADIENPTDFNENEANLFETEEEYHIHSGRLGHDSRLSRLPPPPMGYKN